MSIAFCLLFLAAHSERVFAVWLPSWQSTWKRQESKRVKQQQQQQQQQKASESKCHFCQLLNLCLCARRNYEGATAAAKPNITYTSHKTKNCTEREKSYWNTQVFWCTDRCRHVCLLLLSEKSFFFSFLQALDNRRVHTQRERKKVVEPLSYAHLARALH